MSKPRTVIREACPNPDCRYYGRTDGDNVGPNGYYAFKYGRRRRYRCRACGRNFNSLSGTVYHRLQKSRATFDEVCRMTAEGVDKASIARIKNISWNTIADWQEKGSDIIQRYQDNILRDIAVDEIQADEIRTFVDNKRIDRYIITALIVQCRLWMSAVVGRRNNRNIHKLFRDLYNRANLIDKPLITTDGYGLYESVVLYYFGVDCVYGQVVKTWRKNRVVTIYRKLVIGTEEELKQALLRSEDSKTLNTSFVERHNLSIRRGCSYLNRRTASFARREYRLAQQIEIYRCYYNFIRPHGALKRGNKKVTPAMQAGLVDRPLTFREIFMSPLSFCVIVLLEWQGGQMVKSNAA